MELLNFRPSGAKVISEVVMLKRYRSDAWKMVWFGHPWVSVRFQAPSLILSQPHERETPSDCWAISPDELIRAVDDAKAELERFTEQIDRLLPILGYREPP